MTRQLAGKRAFVTGAGQGIGRAVALAFAQDGAEVIAVSRTPAKMHDLSSMHSSIVALGLDVTRADEIAEAVSRSGPIDVLFNCAGWVHDGTILDCSDEDWERSLDQNVTSCFRTIRCILPQMLARRSGDAIRPRL